MEFRHGKRKKKDVQEFELRLMDNILALHEDLKQRTYQHGGYHAFRISDPKQRDIHKASVQDRLVHHAIYRILYPFFDRAFIADSYSCRNEKGVHRALNQFQSFSRKASCNHTKTAWVLKCDVRKFFASIDQGILMGILHERIANQNILLLLEKVIGSFSSSRQGVGLPLGNLTSQLLVNIYMNEFDQFVKHRLKVRYFIRYADDFVIFSQNRTYLEEILEEVREFLRGRLRLDLHPDKVSIATFSSGVDFLGWVHFPHHRILRTVTKRRMLKKINEKNQVSYLGLLSHGNAYTLGEQIRKCRQV